MTPTEAEIRAALASALEDSSIDIGAWVHELLRPLTYAPPEDRGPNYPDGLWDDLRPSQHAYLEGLREEVYAKVQPMEEEITTRITELVVRAALDFAAAFPDAPRATREAVPA